MKRKQEKFYVLLGPHIELNTSVGPSLTSPELLKTVAKVTVIGGDEGFEYLDLARNFNSSIEEKYFIILNCHGIVREDGYKIMTKLSSISETQKVEAIYVDVKDLLIELVKATNNKPLEILTISCFGENIHDYIDILPPFSKMISFSDKDSIGFVLDNFGQNIEKAFKVITNEDCVLEDLMEIFCLNQKYGETTPVISKKSSDGKVKTISLADYTQNYLMTEKPHSFSGRMELLFNHLAIKKDRVENLVDQIVKSKKMVSDFKLPHSIGNEIIKNIDNNSLQEFNAYLEDFYYLNALKEFDYPYIVEPYKRWQQQKFNIEKQLKEEKFQSLPNTYGELTLILQTPQPSEYSKVVCEKANLLLALVNNHTMMEQEMSKDCWDEEFRATPIHIQKFNPNDDNQSIEEMLSKLTAEDFDYPTSNYTILLALGAESFKISEYHTFKDHVFDISDIS